MRGRSPCGPQPFSGSVWLETATPQVNEGPRWRPWNAGGPIPERAGRFGGAASISGLPNQPLECAIASRRNPRAGSIVRTSCAPRVPSTPRATGSIAAKLVGTRRLRLWTEDRPGNWQAFVTRPEVRRHEFFDASGRSSFVELVSGRHRRNATEGRGGTGLGSEDTTVALTPPRSTWPLGHPHTYCPMSTRSTSSVPSSYPGPSIRTNRSASGIPTCSARYKLRPFRLSTKGYGDCDARGVSSLH
jgi:hypothetical protein